MSAMEEKLQEKFALVQQMKREKELKEAKAKENQPFDIFALAGVNIPTASGAGGRHDSQNSVGRRPRVERSGSISNGTPIGATRRPSQSSMTSPVRGSEDNTSTPPGTEKKLKRSSMAVRNTAQGNGQDERKSSSHLMDYTATPVSRGRQLSVGSVTSSVSTPSHTLVESPITATPPTPIASPRTESSTKQENVDNPSTQPVQRARDMTRNVHSRAGSVDENEEMVLDVYGRSIPRSRRQSSDDGSDYGNDSAHVRRRRRADYEDDCRQPYHRPTRYEPRYQSRSRSRSRSPKRRNSGRSRSRSISPYYSRGDDDYYRRRDHNSHYGRGRRSDYENYQPEEPQTSGQDTDPYLAASRYLDTAFYPTKIYVGNLPESVSLTSLRTAFGPFGDIGDMNLVEGKDFGFVTYKEPEAARKALEKMNGATLDGTVIRVNRAKIPERNRHGFAGVAWMDEDGELARMEEEQHQQAAAIAKTLLAPGAVSGTNAAGQAAQNHRSPSSSTSNSTAAPEKPSRPIHQLPPRPRSPKLPPKPTTSFPPVGMDPRAAIAARGGGRQILKYDDL
ncbi:hypothetical protein BGX21_007468 [Mortierella sp. AD011]|nr:hypothetical protein BGX21_007468 [Mortierella sp. AD011]